MSTIVDIRCLKVNTVLVVTRSDPHQRDPAPTEASLSVFITKGVSLSCHVGCCPIKYGYILFQRMCISFLLRDCKIMHITVSWKIFCLVYSGAVLYILCCSRRTFTSKFTLLSTAGSGRVSLIAPAMLKVHWEKHSHAALGSCDRASWAKYEERRTNKMQQLDVYY